MTFWTKEKDNEMINLLNSGCPPVEVSKKMGVVVGRIHNRSHVLRREGISIKSYGNNDARLRSKTDLSLDQLKFLLDSTGSSTEVLKSYLIKYPDATQTAYTILGLICHKARIKEQILNKTPKPKIQKPIVFEERSGGGRLIEKTECELLTEILNELRILNSYAAQPKKPQP